MLNLGATQPYLENTVVFLQTKTIRHRLSTVSEEIIQKALESFSERISDLGEARLCLDSLLQDFDPRGLQLFQQIKEEKVFVIVDEVNLWIATSAVRSIDAGTVLKSTLNLNLKSMVKNQAKLVKAGIEMAKGSAAYQFQQIDLSKFHSIVPTVETSSWNLNKQTFNLVFLAANSVSLGQLPVRFANMESLNEISNAILESTGKPSQQFGSFIGHLDSEGKIANISRKGLGQSDLITRDSAASFDVWENFIVGTLKNRSISAHEITSDVKAELYEDGQVTVSYVANRAASASHGSIGLNLMSAAFSAPTHDKKKSDTRSLSVQVVAAKWNLEISLDPMHAKKARAIVTRINQNVEILKSKSPQPENSNPNQDISSSLAKLADLKAQGLLSDEEFEKAKARLLS